MIRGINSIRQVPVVVRFHEIEFWVFLAQGQYIMQI